VTEARVRLVHKAGRSLSWYSFELA